MSFFRTAVLGLVAVSVKGTLIVPEESRIKQSRNEWIVAAKRACNHVKAIDFDACVLQIIETSDLNMAEAYRPSLSDRDNIQRSLRGSSDDGSAQEYDDDDDDDDDDKLLRLAQEACAMVKDVDKHLCVQDVLVTEDVDIAGIWPKHRQASKSGGNEPKDKLLVQAKRACQSVKEVDRLLCIEDVLFTRDLGVAELWPKEFRRRHLSDTALLKEAKEACQYVKAVDRQLCIDDVLMTGDVGIAELWPKSLPVRYEPNKQGRYLSDSLLKEAKEACQYVKEVDEQLCIDDVLMTGDVGIAELWPKSLPVHDEPKKQGRHLASVLLKEAKDACKSVKVVDRQLCIDDVLSTGNIGTAESWTKTPPVERRLVTSQEAENACVYFTEPGRQSCIDAVLQADDISVAEQLRWQDAEEVCQYVIESYRGECVNDVFNTGDVNIVEYFTQIFPVPSSAPSSAPTEHHAPSDSPSSQHTDQPTEEMLKHGPKRRYKLKKKGNRLLAD